MIEQLLNGIWNWLAGFTDTVLGSTLLTIIGSIVIIGILVRHLSNLKLSFHEDYSRKSREANLLALGLLPIKESGAYWNDPTASGLEDDQKAQIVEEFGLRTSQDVLDLVVELLTQRARRDDWEVLLAARARATQANGGRKPTIEAWLAEAQAAGRTGRGQDYEFAHVIEQYEKELGRQAFPHREPLTSFDGYALAQAVAISNWAVGLGLITESASLRLIEQANEIARAEFSSWAAFGRSFILGRAMVLGDGTFNDEQLKRARKSANKMYSALDDDSTGEWDSLPWQLP